MRHAPSAIVLFLLMAIEAGAATQDRIGAPSDEAAIRQLMTDLAGAWNGHDIDSYSAFFAEDVDFTNWRGTLRVHGRAALRSTHAPLFTGMFRQSQVSVTDTRLRFFTPTLAAVHCVWEMAGIIGYDGKKMVPTRRYLPLFIVSMDHGRWLVAIMHNVLVQPLPAGAEEKIRGPVKE